MGQLASKNSSNSVSAEHLLRGSEYLERGFLDEAIQELTAAVAMADGGIEPYEKLCLAYGRRYQKSGSAEDKEQAISFANHCIKMDPKCESAYDILKSLQTSSARRHVRNICIGLILFGAITLAVALLAFKIGSFGERADHPAATEVQSEPHLPSTKSATIRPEVSRPREGASTSPIPVKNSSGMRKMSFRLADYSALIEPEVKQSEMDVYSESAYYNYKVLLRNVSDREITEGVFEFQAVGSGGDIIRSWTEKAPDVMGPPARPGDTIPVSGIQDFKDEAIANLSENLPVEIIVIAQQIETKPVPDYPETRDVSLDFRSNPAWEADWPVIIRERSSTTNYYRHTDQGTGYFIIELEAENTGDLIVKEIKLALDLFDGKGKRLTTNDVYLSGISTGSIYPGEIVVRKVVVKAKRGTEGYKLRVMNFETVRK